MPTSAPYRFSPELFKFLRDLKTHNARPWFEEHKPRYVEFVQRPFLAFIRAFAPRLATISKFPVASAKPIGGSMFRIYRDIRFTKDKTPYATHVSARFRHARDVLGHGPGFYLHIEPGDCSAGAGIWEPPTAQALAIRQAIVARPAAWRAIVNAPSFKGKAEFWGDSMKRPPRGVPPDHPLMETLKRRSFIPFIDFTEAQVLAPDFLDRFTDACRALSPVNGFLAKAIGLPW